MTHNRQQPGVVLVTGASSGIGQATCLRLATDGWEVLAGVRDLARAPHTDGSAGSIHPVRLDVTDDAGIPSAVARVRQLLAGRALTALVNNAGIGQLAPMATVALDDLRAIFEVNVFGTVALTQAALPLMGPGSRLLFIGSVGDRITMPYGGPLTSSKWAIASIAEAFRLELAAEGIDVVLVEPGSIATPAVDKVEQAARRTADQLQAREPELARRFDAAVQRAVANERSGSSPEVVADTVARALGATRPRSRYLTGRHARLLAALGHLPDPAFDTLRLRLFGQPSRRRDAAPATSSRTTATTDAGEER